MASKNVVAIITGASSGLGKATALLFAKNGYRLSLAGRNEKALREVAQECIASGGLAKEQVVTTIGDVCEEKTLIEIVGNTSKQFGQIDVLVNCAGILSTGGAETTPLPVLDNLMRVNVNSMIRLTQLAVPHLEKTKGSIVNVSSITGICAVIDTQFERAIAGYNPHTKRPKYLEADERILSKVQNFVNNPNQNVILFLRGIAHNFRMA